MRILFAFLLMFASFSCQEDKKESQYLGYVNIEISGKKDALPHFGKGLLLLHSFEYEDSREAFVKAQEIDPGMAMAYWGEAMTYNHSLWSEQDYDQAKRTLLALSQIDYENSVSDLESDLIKSLDVLYAPETPKKERDKAYAQYMEELNKKYPDNHEVAAFYALSLLGSAEEGRDDVLYGKGAKVAQGIIDENAKHPGALHYLIHSYDDPEHAGLALTAANSYSVVAPDASHALHMPSHIYVATGMWDEVISSNIDSYQASINRMEKKELDNDARGYHAYHWLQYGHLQIGNLEEAKKMVTEMETFMKEKPSTRARAHMVFLKGTYLCETDEWQSDIADIPIDISDLNISIRSQYHFLEGMKAYHNSDLKKMDSIVQIMESDYERESYLVTNEGVKLCSAVTREQANFTDLTEAEIRRTQLQALQSSLEGDPEQAKWFFEKSLEFFEGINYSYGPPSIQEPVYELYADWLKQTGNIEGARKNYEISLKHGPKRSGPTKSLHELEILKI